MKKPRARIEFLARGCFILGCEWRAVAEDTFGRLGLAASPSSLVLFEDRTKRDGQFRDLLVAISQR